MRFAVSYLLVLGINISPPVLTGRALVKLLCVPERGGEVASQLTLFDLGAIPSGSPDISASVRRSRQRRRGVSSASFQISLDFN